MKTRACIIILLLMAACQMAAAQMECSIVVEENGNALVLYALEGADTIAIPLPPDVTYPQVLNALYVETSDGIEVSLTDGEPATIAYQTSMLTEKSGGNWALDADLGGTGYSILLSLPKSANILSTEPRAAVSETGDSKNLIWDSDSRVSVEYSFLADPKKTTTTRQVPTTVTSPASAEPQDEGGYGALIVLAGITVVGILILAIIGVYILMKRGRPSEGMRKVMRTLGGNEYKIIDTLLKHGGGMKRSELERTASISKSSLALALNNLERKNIVDVDRTNTTHFVEVTEWFKGL